MDIQTLTKIRNIIGNSVDTYITLNAGKLHTSPHNAVLAFGQKLLADVTVQLQKEVVLPVANNAPAKTSKPVVTNAAPKRVRRSRAEIEAAIAQKEAEAAANPPVEKVVKKISTDAPFTTSVNPEGDVKLPNKKARKGQIIIAAHENPTEVTETETQEEDDFGF